MKWVEIINLRSAGTGRESIEREVLRSMAEVEQRKNMVEVRMYRHAAVDTDLSIHLHYESGQADVRPSTLGLRLASALEEFGLINHSVWIEEERK